jgi:hypothetical protein
MRGKDEVRGSLFSYVDLERRVRADHPLRVIRGIVNAALSEMSGEFDALYAISQRIRKRIEEAFGWAKTVAGLRKARHCGLAKIDWQFTFAMAAYNLVRSPKLLGAALP